MRSKQMALIKEGNNKLDQVKDKIDLLSTKLDQLLESESDTTNDLVANTTKNDFQENEVKDKKDVLNEDTVSGTTQNQPNNKSFLVEPELTEETETSEKNQTEKLNGNSFHFAQEDTALFEKDKKEFNLAKRIFNKWADYIHLLAKTFDNDIVYEFGELLEKDEYNIQKTKRVFFLPLYNKEEDNQKLFEGLGKEVQSLSDANPNESIYTYEKANVRRSTELDYSLSMLGPTKKVNTYAKDILNNTFSLSLKQLERSRKELIHLLSKTINLQKKLQIELQHPLLINSPKNEVIETIGVTDNWIGNNSKIIKDIENASESIFKAYKEFLKRLFKVYNEIQGRHKNFINEITLMKDEERHFIEIWDTLFEDISQLIIKYLETSLHICPIECNRGDTYNHHFHLPQGGGEPDNELENDRIKSAETTGFRFIGNYEVHTPISEITTIELKELKPQYILLQTEVTVVLNKSKSS